ncbi:MAG TPA: TadE family protein [Gemmataceae bacterium]|nr:TadE family protein [Gemmataceae bacterium]
MNTWKLPPRKRRALREGAAAVEFAVVLPLLLLLLLGIWEVGRLVQVSQIVDNASREGGRLAASGAFTDDGVKIAVCQYMKDAGLPDYTSQRDTIVTVTNISEPGVDSSNAAQLDHIQVTVSIPFKDVRWIALYLVTNNNTKITAQSDWYSTRNQSFPTNVTSPPGF